MTTKRKNAVHFLENLTGGSLTFGRMLVSIRKSEDINQVDFADMLGVSKAYLCDVEKDRRNISPLRASAWAKKLGYPIQLFIELAIQTNLNKNGFEFKVKLIA